MRLDCQPFQHIKFSICKKQKKNIDPISNENTRYTTFISGQCSENFYSTISNVCSAIYNAIYHTIPYIHEPCHVSILYASIQFICLHYNCTENLYIDTRKIQYQIICCRMLFCHGCLWRLWLMAKVKLENLKSSRTNHIGKGGELRLVGCCIQCIGDYTFLFRILIRIISEVAFAG